MNKDTRNMLKYLKEDEQVEVPSYESFRNQILNDLEMYYEDLANEDGDVFAGTQDSYANEMVEQHLFDTLLYNIKHNYMSKDAAMQTANNLVYYILDFVDHGEEITLQNDKVIKEVYNKYVLNKKEESMETIRKYISEPEKHRGTSIRFDTFKVGPYEYDLRVYVGLASRDRVRAALIPYKLDKEGRYIKVDKDTIELDDFRLDMTDEEVRSLVRNKLSLKESMDESVEPKWFKNKKLYNKFKSFVDKQLKDGAIDDPEYIKTLSPEEYESLLVDTWMKDQDEIDMFEEHIKSGYYGEESMNESVDQKSLKKELFVHLNGPRAALNQAIKELKADNEHYLKVESNIRFNYENLIEDLTNTLHSIVEFQNSLLVSELESKGDSNEKNS